MKKIIIIIFLLLLSPILAELVSGSAPPLLFFNPFVFLIMIITYGCMTLLIREAKVRWKLQWSFIFLLPIMGIFIEGILMQSFFNTAHMDLGILSNYGTFFGVQWPWTISLTIYHAIVALLIPILIVDHAWPKFRDQPLLKKRGIIICFLALILVTAFWLYNSVLLKGEAMYSAYNMELFPNLILVGIMVFLVWLAYKFKDSKIKSKMFVLSPFIFGVIAFLFMFFNVSIHTVMAENQISGIPIFFIEIIFIALFLLFVFFQIYNKNITKRHIVALVIGTLLFWIILAFFQEFGGVPNLDNPAGMAIVSIVALILLFVWRHRVLEKS